MKSNYVTLFFMIQLERKHYKWEKTWESLFKQFSSNLAKK